jgi:6-hydroxytryprostatin B O-methyltransferase
LKTAKAQSQALTASYRAHDVWKPQPLEIASSADVYLLRRVLHDWSSAKTRVILQNLVDAMRPGARIVVVDIVITPPGTVSPLQEAFLRVFDLAMAQTFNSSERDRSDWIKLFASTTPLQHYG